MAGEQQRIIHRSPRRMVAGLVVVGVVMIAQVILSIIIILQLFDRIVGLAWVGERASLTLSWGLAIAGLAGTVLVMRGMDR